MTSFVKQVNDEQTLSHKNQDEWAYFITFLNFILQQVYLGTLQATIEVSVKNACFNVDSDVSFHVSFERIKKIELV